MFKLPHRCTHLTGQQGIAENSPARFQQYMNQKLPEVSAGFRKGRGTRDQIANIRWITENVTAVQKKISVINYAKAFL